MTTRRVLLLGVWCALAGSTTSWAEPMFLSKQYPRCSSCHYSPSGGGLLTPYGRSLSGQELSTTSRPTTAVAGSDTVSGEEAFLFGALGEALGPVQLGISLRPSRLHYEVGTFSDSRNLLMTADLAAAYRTQSWTVYGEVGRKPAIGVDDATAYSREHWVSYGRDDGLGIKVGRFLPAYGVHFADHTSFNRAGLGFDKYDQVYGIEVTRTSDTALAQVSLSPGRAESISDDDGRRAVTATGRLQVDLGPRLVVVGSGLYRGESSLETRNGAVGGAVGFAPFSRLTTWTEGDARLGGNGGNAFVFVNETSLEVVRGVWLKVSPQVRTDTARAPGVFRLGLGADLLPRTHWNISLSVYRDKTKGSEDALETVLAQLHLYL